MAPPTTVVFPPWVSLSGSFLVGTSRGLSPEVAPNPTELTSRMGKASHRAWPIVSACSVNVC